MEVATGLFKPKPKDRGLEFNAKMLCDLQDKTEVRGKTATILMSERPTCLFVSLVCLFVLIFRTANVQLFNTIAQFASLTEGCIVEPVNTKRAGQQSRV
jgi:hypothetical protein